jgi:hypothetical protein
MQPGAHWHAQSGTSAHSSASLRYRLRLAIAANAEALGQNEHGLNAPVEHPTI